MTDARPEVALAKCPKCGEYRAVRTGLLNPFEIFCVKCGLGSEVKEHNIKWCEQQRWQNAAGAYGIKPRSFITRTPDKPDIWRYSSPMEQLQKIAENPEPAKIAGLPDDPQEASGEIPMPDTKELETIGGNLPKSPATKAFIEKTAGTPKIPEVKAQKQSLAKTGSEIAKAIAPAAKKTPTTEIAKGVTLGGIKGVSFEKEKAKTEQKKP